MAVGWDLFENQGKRKWLKECVEEDGGRDEGGKKGRLLELTGTRSKVGVPFMRLRWRKEGPPGKLGRGDNIYDEVVGLKL